MRLLVIDNFDSFTYNLVQFLGELGAELEVFRNDAITVEEIRRNGPDGIVISPGPGTPDSAGISLELIAELSGQIPILGVCLGHQAIGQAFGGEVIQAPELMHGKRSEIHHKGQSVFANLNSPFNATRYHSLVVKRDTFPECLHITAQTESGLIMGLHHKEFPIAGIQFHPESFITEHGKIMLGNFMNICQAFQAGEAPSGSSDPAAPVARPRVQPQTESPTIIKKKVNNMVQTAIKRIIDGVHLSREEAKITMDTIMKGEATEAQIGAFLIGMRMKGEQPAEIAGFAESMRSQAHQVTYSGTTPAVDIVGTGGDGKHTFNISTVASFVVAGAGIPMAKHGNRSVSSKCGSADVLKALGIKIDLNAEQMSRCLNEVGISFIFAPMVHPAMKHAIGPRREIGVRSIFNILGPITNPAGVKHQLIGVYDRKLAPLLAEVLRQLESERIMLVHSADGMDEISLAAPTYVTELNEGDISHYEIDPAQFGLEFDDSEVTGGDAQVNARIALGILEGKKGTGRNIVLVNAAACLYVAGRTSSLEEATKMAAASIDDGHAMGKLQALKNFTSSL